MINIDGKEYRNLQEQVKKNQEDIKLLKFGLNIKGRVNDVPNLPADAEIGDTYMVGKAAPYYFYIKSADKTWDNLGKLESDIPGPKGNAGETGEEGIGILDMNIDNDGILHVIYTNGDTKALGKVVGDTGPMGLRGFTGKPAAITEAIATIDNKVGTPSVVVTTGGTDDNRSFGFEFHNLKGERGETGPSGIGDALLENTFDRKDDKNGLTQKGLYQEFGGENMAQIVMYGDYPFIKLTIVDAKTDLTRIEIPKWTIIRGKDYSYELPETYVKEWTRSGSSTHTMYFNKDTHEVNELIGGSYLPDNCLVLFSFFCRDMTSKIIYCDRGDMLNMPTSQVKTALIIPYKDAKITIENAPGHPERCIVSLPKSCHIRYDNVSAPYSFSDGLSVEFDKDSVGSLKTVLFNIQTKTLSVVPIHGTVQPSEYYLFSFYMPYGDREGKFYTIEYPNLIKPFSVAPTPEEDKTDILALNPPETVGKKVMELKRAKNLGSNTFDTKPLVFSVMADIHGWGYNLKRFIEFNKAYKNYIDDQMILGDIIAVDYNSDYTFWTNEPDAKYILQCIGNHDVSHAPSQLDIYNKFIGQWKDNWGGIVQPANADTEGICDYYKDYPTQKVRLIMLNCMNYRDGAQLTWLQETLEDARVKGYGVIFGEHFNPPEGKEYIKEQLGNGNFCDYDQKFNGFCGGWSWSYFNAFDAFVEAGGEFIAFMCGHVHTDQTGIVTTPKGHKYLCITMENCYCGSECNDGIRVRDTKTADSFNIISIDRTCKTIKLVRVGNDCDRYLRSKKSFAYNYDTHTVISQE